MMWWFSQSDFEPSAVGPNAIFYDALAINNLFWAMVNWHAFYTNAWMNFTLVMWNVGALAAITVVMIGHTINGNFKCIGGIINTILPIGIIAFHAVALYVT